MVGVLTLEEARKKHKKGNRLLVGTSLCGLIKTGASHLSTLTCIYPHYRSLRQVLLTVGNIRMCNCGRLTAAKLYTKIILGNFPTITVLRGPFQKRLSYLGCCPHSLGVGIALDVTPIIDC